MRSFFPLLYLFCMPSLPPYHIAGVVSVISSVYAGRKVVQLPNFSASEWVGQALKHAVTTAFMVPTMLGAIVEEIERRGGVEPLRLTEQRGVGEAEQ